jgi:hypothetical protein
MSDDSKVLELVQMGFTSAQAIKGLEATGGNVTRSVEWCLSHPDEVANEDEHIAVVLQKMNAEGWSSEDSEDEKERNETLFKEENNRMVNSVGVLIQNPYHDSDFLDKSNTQIASQSSLDPSFTHGIETSGIADHNEDSSRKEYNPNHQVEIGENVRQCDTIPGTQISMDSAYPDTLNEAPLDGCSEYREITRAPDNDLSRSDANSSAGDKACSQNDLSKSSPSVEEHVLGKNEFDNESIRLEDENHEITVDNPTQDDVSNVINDVKLMMENNSASCTESNNERESPLFTDRDITDAMGQAKVLELGSDVGNSQVREELVSSIVDMANSQQDPSAGISDALSAANGQNHVNFYFEQSSMKINDAQGTGICNEVTNRKDSDLLRVDKPESTAFDDVYEQSTIRVLGIRNDSDEYGFGNLAQPEEFAKVTRETTAGFDHSEVTCDGVSDERREAIGHIDAVDHASGALCEDVQGGESSTSVTFAEESAGHVEAEADTQETDGPGTDAVINGGLTAESALAMQRQQAEQQLEQGEVSDAKQQAPASEGDADDWGDMSTSNPGA